MTKLAQLPRFDRAAAAEPAEGRAPRLRTRYYAFLSYSHKDKELADWLHRELEKFRVPSALAGKLTANGVVPKRLTPIFRDQHDLSAGDDLAVEIEAALAASQFLLVLCSPTAAKSHWTNLEIESFKRTRPEGCVLAAVVAGEPFASDIPGREDEECFPPALRYKYDRRGHRTPKRAEPLAADFRALSEGRRLAFLKLVAGMLGVGLDELVQRDQTRRHRQLAFLAAGSLAGMAVTSTLAVTAIHARDAAREQRRQAEGLVDFMLGDLKNKLEPIGRLDALDGVGSRVLAYYSRQNMSELSDVGLAQRSQALALMGQIAFDRGDLARADRFYRAAYDGTAEQVRRNPADAQHLYDNAQNVFYIAQIAVMQGRLDHAEQGFREYRRLADRMVALDPNNIKWRMEVEDAAANLGYALYKRRDFTGALEQFDRALSTIQGVLAVAPDNVDYQMAAASALPLLSDAQEANGRLSAAIESRKREIEFLQRLLPKVGAQAQFMLVAAHRDLGQLYNERGQTDLASQELHESTTEGEKLIAIDPTALKWAESTELARLMLAQQAFSSGQVAAAAQQAQSICSGLQQLVAHDPGVARRQAGLRDCLVLRAEISLRTGEAAAAAALASRAVKIAESAKSADPADDRFGLATTLRVLGDSRSKAGDGTGAKSAWSAALAAIPGQVAEKPREMAEHAKVLERLGRSGEAAPLRAHLLQIGFRESTI
jgi:tetratricopeptide (TPR) repeat protein